MTTPPQNPDPFASPAPQGTQAPMPPAASYQPIAVPTASGPWSIASWATVLTGLTALATVAGALTAGALVDNFKTTLDQMLNDAPAPTSVQVSSADVVSLVSSPIQIASYVLLALWMWRLRTVQRGRGEDPGGIPALEWWGWFVPIANAVLPAVAMRRLTRRTVPVGLVLGWWMTYVASSLVVMVTAVATVLSAIDMDTGTAPHLERLDSLVPAYAVSAGLMVISWVFLATIIRIASAQEKAASRA